MKLHKINSNKFVLLLICGLVVFTGSAQNFKVKITSNKMPLGYSYLYINGDVKEVVNSDGEMILDLKKLNPGDTISASFVGYSKNEIVLTEDIMKIGECSIDLLAQFDIDEIVVKMDAEKLLKKYARWSPFYHYGDIKNLDYNYVIKKDGVVVKKDNGTLPLVFVYRYEGKNVRNPLPVYGYVEDNAKENIDFSKQFISSAFYDISITAQYYSYMLKGKFDNKETLEYKGIVDSCRVFAAIQKQENFVKQIICYFNKETNNLSRCEISLIEYDSDGHIILKRDSQLEVESLKMKKSIITQYVIKKATETLRYKNIDASISFDVTTNWWKYDKEVECDRAKNVKLFLGSDFTNKKY